VSAVFVVPGAGTYVVESIKGDVVRVPMLMTNLAKFARHVITHASSRIDDELRSHLEHVD
jgi:hypothetical protein